MITIVRTRSGLRNPDLELKGYDHLGPIGTRPNVR